MTTVISVMLRLAAAFYSAIIVQWLCVYVCMEGVSVSFQSISLSVSNRCFLHVYMFILCCCLQSALWHSLISVINIYQRIYDFYHTLIIIMITTLELYYLSMWLLPFYIFSTEQYIFFCSKSFLSVCDCSPLEIISYSVENIIGIIIFGIHWAAETHNLSALQY